MVMLFRSPLRAYLPIVPNVVAGPTLSSIRYASLTSAIGRGLHKSRAAEKKTPWSGRGKQQTRENFSRDSFHQDRFHEYRFKRNPRERGSRERNSQNEARRPRGVHGFNRDKNQDRTFNSNEEQMTRFRELPRDLQKRFGTGTSEPTPERHWGDSSDVPDWRAPKQRYKKKKEKHYVYSNEVPVRVKRHVLIPQGIPYATSASEFIYGTSAVQAALYCTRRQLYQLYLYQRQNEELSPEKLAMRKLALTKSIPVKMTHAEWDTLMDKMSAGRPHNGVILDASPLPKLPVTKLEPVESIHDDHFQVILDKQSKEEAEINGTNNRLPIISGLGLDAPSNESRNSRYPFLLFLDGILDPGNMGAILRSAYYLGVDAVILGGRNSAPLSPVTIKASAGAAENITLLTTKNEIDFVIQSQSAGWRFYAADAPGNIVQLSGVTEDDGGRGRNMLTEAPTVLMLGSEATGLMPRLKARADGLLTIPGARFRPEIGLDDPARVDSLNVSVAAALLMGMLIHSPLRIANVSSEHQEPAQEEESDQQPERTFEFN